MIHARQETLEGTRRHVQSLEGPEHVQTLEITLGHAKIVWDVHPSALNLYGNLYGGLIFAPCDMVTGTVIYAYEVSNVTQQNCIHFIKSANFGRLCVQADAVYKGNRAVIHHVGVTTPEGKVAADAIFTMFLLDPV